MRAGLVEGALEDLEREVKGRWRAKVARDHADEPAEEPKSLKVDSAAVEGILSEGPASAIAEPTVSDPTAVEEQAAESPEQPEVVAPLVVEELAIEGAQEAFEADVSSEETELSTDTESSADSFDDVEADTFRSASTITPSSTLKGNHNGQSTQIQVNEQGKGKVSDEGSDWSEVEA